MKQKSWSKMSKKDKRIAIAQDVITQVKNSIYKIDTGNYIDMLVPNFSNSFEEKEFNSKQFRDVINEGKVTCEVCAKGSLFLALILKENHLKVGEVNNDNDEICNRLNKIFSQAQLDMIEAAFEQRVIKDRDIILTIVDKDNKIDGTPTALGRKCIKFGNKYKSVKNRLIAIMNNIIINDGEFIP